MFRRRRSNSHHQHSLSTSNTQSAQSAASHAFLKSQPSSSSLSSAAAAAALRSRSPTPTLVENVQTKRTLQRRSSVSSQHSVSSLRPPATNRQAVSDLRRSHSSSSMSSRTFREQSPRGPSLLAGGVDRTPPIPTIPPEFASRGYAGRRAASVGPAMRPASPALQRPTSRGMSVDREVRGPVSRSAVQSQVQRPPPELQRSESRNSINFSYPMTSRPNSPPPSPPSATSAHRDVATGASLAGQLSSSQQPRPAHAIHQTANTSARRKTKSVPSVGTAVAAAQAAIVPRSDDPGDMVAAPRVVAQPERTVREPTTRQENPLDLKPLPRPPTPAKQSPGSPKGDERVVVGVKEGKQRAAPRSPATPEPAQDHVPSSIFASPQYTRTDLPRGALSPPSSQSNSPGRSARFSNQLFVSGLEGHHMHQPPPRSVSPVKSAMKDSRKGSLSPDGRATTAFRPGPPLSEGSDGTSVASDEGSRPGAGIRKRSVRVSFDDEAEILGTAASPPTSPEDVSPDQSSGASKLKTAWQGMSKKMSPTRDGQDEYQDMLTPRPALPSFGSIRGEREGDDHATAAREESDEESTSSSETDAAAQQESFSNDHAVGGIISGTRPLAPPTQPQLDRVPSTILEDVTEDQQDVDNQGEDLHSSRPESLTVPADLLRAPESLPEEKPTQTPILEVPETAVQPATHEIERKRASLEGFDVPGGFPRSSIDSRSSARKMYRRSLEKAAGDPTSDHHPEGRRSEDDSGESIYSDAEENFDAGSGDGFGSINAIVDSRRSLDRARRSKDLPKPPEDVYNAQKSSQESSHQPEPFELPAVPAVCQIARAVSPPGRAPAPAPRAPSPESNCLLPFTSPYPPFPSRQKRREHSMPGMSRSYSSSMEPSRWSTPGDTYGPTGVNGTARQQSGEVGPQAQARVGLERQRQRPVSWGPVSLEGGVAASPDIRGQVNDPAARPSSNGSESLSSPKIATRTQSPYTMRRTLRGGSTGEAPSSPDRQIPSSGGSSSHTRPQSSGTGSSTFRSTLRGSPPRREKPSFFSTGKLSRGKKSKSSTFQSRFADSDSDNDGDFSPRKHTSHNSSVGEPQRTHDFRPVRGIPRRHNDGDSTELEDSSDGERHGPTTSGSPRAQDARPSSASPPGSPSPLAAVARSRGMTEEQIEEFLRQPPRPQRPSLLHRLSMRGSRSKSATRGESTSSIGTHGPGPGPEVHDGQQQRSGNVVTTVTAANQEKEKEKEKQEEIPTSSPSKLSKKAPGSDAWPLQANSNAKETGAGTENPGASAPSRPQTADGDANGDGDRDERRALSVGFSTEGRKRRFSRLRKALGLRT